MGMTYEIEEMQNILVVSITGDPNVDDIKRILSQTQNVSGYSHNARLWDFQKSGFNFSQNEILDIAAYASSADNRPAKVAILVNEDLSFGVSRVYEVFRQTDMTELKSSR